MCEPYPELSSDDDPKRRAYDDADHRSDGRLPGDRGRKLPLGEPEGFEQGKVAAPATDGGGEGETEGEDRPGSEPCGQDQRSGADGAVVDDLGRALDSAEVSDK